jgi:outer membrane protein assembly factor BamE (lipoprotein component of BamABCDE complex)
MTFRLTVVKQPEKFFKRRGLINMGMITATRILLILVVYLVAGCDMDAVGSKKTADPNEIAKIVPGQSSKADVQAEFGPPSQTSFSDNGDETWMYVHMSSGMTSAAFIPGAALFSAPVKTSNDTLTIRFDRRGIVRNVGTGQVKSNTNGLLN